MTTKYNFANTDAEKLLKYIINDVGHSKTVCAIVNEINNDYDYVDSIKYGRFSEINKFSIYNMENNPLKHNNIVMHNFGMEITYNKDGALNHMDLVKNFELDVEYKENKNGLIVSQLQNGKEIILKKPYDISDSARKINKETKDHPVGFSGISYAKKKNLVKYTCPPDIIPIGCWCDICKKCGPKGHDVGCTFPNFSSLKLTLLGYIKCLFSDDKSYQSKLLEISDSSKKRITFKFLNEVLEKLNENFKLDQNDETHTIDDVNDLVDVQIILDVKRLSMVLENVDDKFFINIANKITRNDYFIAEYDTAEDKDISNIFTDFNLEDIKSIPGLNKSGKKEYFPGTVILQYSLLEKKTTIRFYDDFIHFITVPLNADYKQIIFNVFKRFNVAIKTKYVPLNVTIEVAKGSFNVISNEYTDVDINLNRLYSSFHPVDKNKNPINKNDFMYTKEFMTPDDFVKKVNFTDFENSKFEFTITPPENKRMTMTFIEYNKLSNPGYYKITAQIHSSGIIQLTFGYTEGSKEYVKLDNSLKYNQDEIIQVGKGIENLLEYQTNFINHLINYQLNTTVKKSFSTIKNLFYSKLSEIFDKTPDIFMRIESKKKSSDMIYNIIPGIMPYRKKIFPHAGNLVDFFDDENPEYSDNHGWSNTDNDRGYIVEVIKNKEDMPNTYKIIKGIPKELKILKINQLDKNFIPDKLNICPIVKTTEGDAYLLEEYEPDEKDKFWTISVDYGSKEYEYKSFRIYRYSITGKFDKGDVQVCSKTVGEGVEMRPEPYSFYGRCVHPDTTVLMSNGTLMKISDLQKIEKELSYIKVVDPLSRQIVKSGIDKFQCYDSIGYGKNIIKITTRSGRSITTTDDHPFATIGGLFTEAGKLEVGSKVLVLPTPTKINSYESSSDVIIMDSCKFSEIIKKYNIVTEKTIEKDIVELNNAGLLPLCNNDSRMITLAHLVGYNITDGNANSSVEFYMGCEEDMIQLREETKLLGIGNVTDGHINTSKHTNKLNGKITKHTTWRISISGSLARLIIAMGAIPGNKTKQESFIPDFVKLGNERTKLAFLSALFGGDGSALWYSKCGKGLKVECPSYCITKEEELTENLENYLEEIKKLLSEFDINTCNVFDRKNNSTKNTNKVERKFVVSNQYDNILRFINTINYKWCKQKQSKMCIVGEYIRHVTKKLNEKMIIKNKAIKMYNEDKLSYLNISKELNIPQSTVVNWVKEKYSKNNLTRDYISFINFIKETDANIENGTLYDYVESIEYISNEECPIVMDLTTVSEIHTFVSNGFVTHNCPGGLNETVNPVGLRSRKDNKFYPVCEKIKDRNTADKDTINFLLNGLNEKQLYEADIDPSAEFELYGEKLEDKYAGTFRPGTIDRGNKITFWNKDESNPKWLEGIIIDYKKDHGLGNDLNYVKFIVDVDADENEDDEFQLTKKYEVYGEQFHPKHREKRNFEGLNKLIPDKEKQKQFVISCAKKLNLVKPSIPLMEVSNKNRDKILQSLNKLFKKQFDFSTSLRKIKPFVKNNILELSKNYHLAAMIPSYGIRCLLYLENENEQYVISQEENVMSVTVVSSDDIPSKTLIEGYITETKLFYPIDLIYYEGKLLTTDYINYSNDGRLYLLQNIVSNFNTSMSYSNSIKILPPLGRSAVGIDESDSFNAFVGPSSEKTNLLKFVKNNIENNNIIFINKHYDSNLLIWLNNVPHLKIVLQLVKKHEKRKHTWYMGLIDDNDNKHVLLSIPISLDKSYEEGDYVKFKINMMSNGIINEYNPYIDITKSSEEYSKDIEDTINSINLIMYSVEKDVFMNTNKWEFPSIKKTYHPGENFRSPLVE